jgi:hypothetical protein
VPNPAAGAVGGGQLIGVVAATADEAADGAGGQEEPSGKGRNTVALPVATGDGLADGDGNGCWHGAISYQGEAPSSTYRLRPGGQTALRHLRPKVKSRDRRRKPRRSV